MHTRGKIHSGGKVLRTIIKILILIGIAVFAIWGFRYSSAYVPWKHSIAKYTPGPVRSIWTAKVFEKLLKEDITMGEWQEFTVPEPNKSVSDWLKSNEETVGIKHIMTRFENKKEFDNFRRTCAGMTMEYFAGAEEDGRIEVYILGLDRSRRTMYYRTKNPIIFNTDDENLLNTVESNREEYNKTRKAKQQYELFKF